MSHVEGHDKLAGFRATYPKRAPPEGIIRHPDQARRLLPADGVRHLEAAPARGVQPGRPPGAEGGATGCYLWVFDDEGIPHVLEDAPVAKTLADGVVKHTNLTGGAPAYCGGECWFEAPETSRIWVGGASGRYGPRSPEELEDSVAVFLGFGYEVASLGWDEDANKPSRIYRADA